MTVAELKEVLKNIPDHVLVILSSDSEGNGYSPLAGVSEICQYVAESTYNGYIKDEEDYDLYFEEDYEDDDYEYYNETNDDSESVDAIVVWPTN